jgi:predicted small metal-binding protein
MTRRDRDPKDDAISTSQTTGPGGTNPFDTGRRGATGGTGDVNPSAPTTGTEGWGLSGHEGHTTGVSQGQTGQPAEGGDAPAGNVSFRCSEIHPDCNWEGRGKNEDELRPQIEQHAHDNHDMREIGEETWKKIRRLMRRQEAA